MAWQVGRYGSRKFILAVGIGLISSGLVLLGKIDPITYRDIIIATVAAYITGNVWQKKVQP